MSQIVKTELTGTISEVTSNGRFGIVTLHRAYDSPIKSYKQGVLNDETNGRLQLINKHPNSVLIKGTEIKIASFRTADDFLQILQIQT